MIPEKYQYYKFKFKSPDLTIDQAQLIEEFEDSLSTYSLKYSLSFWEEQDYELSMLTEILTSHQLKIYNQIHLKLRKQHEQELIEQDSKKINEISYYKEHIDFIEKKVLPDLLNEPFLRSFELLNPAASKINFLKSEYKAFLIDQKMKVIGEHFRHKREFQPNHFKLISLKHKIIHLVPDYLEFKESMDQPTKAVADYVISGTKRFSDATESLIQAKIEDIKAFAKTNHDKYFEKQKEGWHINATDLTHQDNREVLTMTILLLDKNGYGG